MESPSRLEDYSDAKLPANSPDVSRIHKKDPYGIWVRSYLHKKMLGSHVHKTDPDSKGACGHIKQTPIVRLMVC